MKIVCISDTHGLHQGQNVPDGDILLHAGDITLNGEEEDVISFNAWLGSLPHRHKIVVAGNHDFCFENDFERMQRILTNAVVLNNSSVQIEGINIWGSPISPISPKFGVDWAFSIKRGKEIARYWDLIPNNTDVLITHGPPFGILDKNDFGDSEGCKDLLEKVQKVKPKWHVFGHIHEGYGEIQVGETHYVNASMVGLQSWIANHSILRKLRNFAIVSFQLLKQFRQFILGEKKRKRVRSPLSRFHWQLKNDPICFEYTKE